MGNKKVYLVYIRSDNDFSCGWVGNSQYASVETIGIYDSLEKAKKELENNCGAEIQEFELNVTNNTTLVQFDMRDDPEDW